MPSRSKILLVLGLVLCFSALLAELPPKISLIQHDRTSLLETKGFQGRLIYYSNQSAKFFHLVEYEFVKPVGKPFQFKKIRQLSYGRRPWRYFLSGRRLEGLMVPDLDDYRYGKTTFGSASEGWTLDKTTATISAARDDRKLDLVFGDQSGLLLEMESRDKDGVLWEAAKVSRIKEWSGKDFAWSPKGETLLVPWDKHPLVWGYLRYFEDPEPYQKWIMDGESE